MYFICRKLFHMTTILLLFLLIQLKYLLNILDHNGENNKNGVNTYCSF